MRYDGVPQTPADAREAGWSWFTLTCPSCKRVASLEIEAVPYKRWRDRLAKLARSVVCRRCGHRGAEMAFAEEKRGRDQRQPIHEKHIAFRGDLAVRRRWD